MSEFKTNVMRILEKAKIDYAAHEYPHGKDAVDGISVAKLLCIQNACHKRRKRQLLCICCSRCGGTRP